jgi:hypothetical protein
MREARLAGISRYIEMIIKSAAVINPNVPIGHSRDFSRLVCFALDSA